MDLAHTRKIRTTARGWGCQLPQITTNREDDRLQMPYVDDEAGRATCREQG
jgi:hypothetical protein